MPLGNLFHKRSSQKKKKNLDSKDDSGTESDNVPSPRVEVLDENEVLEKLVAKKSYLKMIVPPTPRNSVCDEILKNKLPLQKNERTEDSLEEAEAENSVEEETSHQPPKQKRSSSESHSEINVETQQSNRRKFGSEGQILSNDSLNISLKSQKQLDEALQQYVDKLIRKSIAKAVNNVDIDSLCKEFVKGVSSRNNSESADSKENSIIEESLTSDCVSEIAEFGNEIRKCSDFKDSFTQQFDDHSSETGSTANEFEDLVKGYLADYEDTGSVDDLKSFDESSFTLSLSDGLKPQSIIAVEHKSDNTILTRKEEDSKDSNLDIISNAEIQNCTEESSDVVSVLSNTYNKHNECTTESTPVDANKILSEDQNLPLTANLGDEKGISLNYIDGTVQEVSNSETFTELDNKVSSAELRSESHLTNSEKEEQIPIATDDQTKELGLSIDPLRISEVTQKGFEQDQIPTEKINESEARILSPEINDDLIAMTTECESLNYSNDIQSEDPPPDIGENLPQTSSVEEGKKVNWKVGYLHVKLPSKSRGKTHLKAWKKRCVAIQPDEFVNDPKNPSLVISVYGAESRKHKATFWQTVSSLKAVVYRSSSHTHRYAFTIAEDNKAIIHLSAESESATQEWMAAVRAVLWPPSPFMQLEKMLSGREFEISLIDNEFAYHAGLLGMYGYLTITPRKLILLHPQEGYVIQEWYLNTVDKFQLVPQPKLEDAHKVLAMTTCSDSSTGKGEILLFCNEAVTLLQSLASTIHQVLSYHSKQDGGKYQKELEEIAEWLVVPPQDALDEEAKAEEHYKVPPRQVKSLLDIPNFIFDKSLSPVASAIYPAPPSADVLEPLDATKSKPAATSHDSGISTCHSVDDFLNCSVASFVLGGGPMTGKSSDSELSDSYTPPRTPEAVKKIQMEQQEERLSVPQS